MTEPSILFEDQNVIVLSKPAGLLSQGDSSGEDNLVDWLREHVKRNYVGLVHRLDRNTSGVMVVAKRTKAARRLTESLKQGKICRVYRAIVHGKTGALEKWENFLVKDPKENRTSIVRSDRNNAKRAVTNLKLIKSFNRDGPSFSYVEFTLETGRSHQIRAQSAHHGFPLVGDRKYGNCRILDRPALHSYSIQFPHPISNEILKFEAVLPEDLKRLLD